jgi:predicted NBD/HSP70 family sugar kinase
MTERKGTVSYARPSEKPAAAGHRHRGDSPALAQSDLRRLNLQLVLRILHAGGVYTISELAKRSQLSRPTTQQAVLDLVESGWITPSAAHNGQTLGRPAQAFEFRPTARYVLGVDIGAYKVVALISDLNGSVVARARHDLDPELPAEERLTRLGDAIDAALADFGRGPDAIAQAALATPGSVDDDGTVIFNNFIPGWVGENPARWVTDRYRIPTQGASDMAMAALAEAWLGSPDVDEMVYMHIGRRLGAAALVGGRPHNGFHRTANQIGLWKGLPWHSSYPELGDPADPEQIRNVLERAANGDPAAARQVAAFTDEVVAGIIPMVILFDPEVLVIGGGASAMGETIAEPIRRKIQDETPFPPVVVCSTLGDEAVALGALRLALDRAEEQLFAELAPPGQVGRA